MKSPDPNRNDGYRVRGNRDGGYSFVEGIAYVRPPISVADGRLINACVQRRGLNWTKQEMMHDNKTKFLLSLAKQLGLKYDVSICKNAGCR